VSRLRGDDPSQRYWFAQRAMGAELFEEVPKVTPFEAAMIYLQKALAGKTRHCPNETCPAPYFITTKKGQKFCSPECGDPVRREAKRRWWNENRGKTSRATSS